MIPPFLYVFPTLGGVESFICGVLFARLALDDEVALSSRSKGIEPFRYGVPFASVPLDADEGVVLVRLPFAPKPFDASFEDAIACPS